MKSLRFAALLPSLVLAVLLLLPGCAEMRTAGGPLGPNRNLGYSAFYDKSGDLRRMPPLHERGVKSLAMIYLPRDQIVLRSYGLMGVNFRSSEVAIELVVPNGFVEDRLITESSSAPFVKTRLATPEETQLTEHTTVDPATGARSFDDTGRQILAGLHGAGVDAVLVAEERESVSDFVFQSAFLPLPSKSLVYKRGWDPHAVAAFRFFLIDTATAKELENSSFTQASAATAPIRWQNSFDLYSLGDRLVIKTALRERLANNVRAMLQLLKVIPGEDGAFLTFDPAEESRANRPYPQ